MVRRCLSTYSGVIALVTLALLPVHGAAADPPGQAPAGAEDDGSKATALTLGGIAPGGLKVDPLGALYLWRAPASGESRLRAVVSGIENEARWDRRLGGAGAPYGILTLDSQTLPWSRSELIEGRELRSEEMYWHQARVGAGLALHSALGPGGTYNSLDAALTVEVGALWFQRGSETADSFVLPSDTFEGRLHLRLRADTLKRDLLGLPASGWAAGADGIWAIRNRWTPWGNTASALTTDGKHWLSASAYAVAAFKVPGLPEAHHLIAAARAGIGSDLDRFSSLRLGGGSSWGDAETLSRAYLPGAAVDEIATSRFAVADLEYRLEVLYFLFLQVKGTLAWADRPFLLPGGTGKHVDSLPGVSAGISAGLPWDMGLELTWSRNRTLEVAEDVGTTKGRSAYLFSLTKVF